MVSTETPSGCNAGSKCPEQTRRLQHPSTTYLAKLKSIAVIYHKGIFYEQHASDMLL